MQGHSYEDINQINYFQHLEVCPCFWLPTWCLLCGISSAAAVNESTTSYIADLKDRARRQAG